ncbi:MAG: hypothetical protein GWP42_04825 [Verrucomicrobiales bacterium]|nr:hypothetical protein [Verrucomicrobiales bacterium]
MNPRYKQMLRVFAFCAIIFGYLWLAVYGTGVKLVFQWPGLLLLSLGFLSLPFVFRVRTGNTSLVCHLSVLSLFIYMGLRAINSPVHYLGRLDTILMLVLYGTYIFFSATNTKSYRLIIIGLFFLLGLANVCVAIYQLEFKSFHILPGYDRVGLGGQLERPSGFYNASPHFAGFMQIVAIMAASLALFSRGLAVRFPCVIVFVISLSGIVMSQSRGSFIALPFGLVILFGFYLFFNIRVIKRQWKMNGKIAVMILGIICVLLVAGTWMIKGFGKRVDSVDDFFADSSRANFRAGAVDQWMESPLFGTGARTFQYKYLQYRPSHAPFHQRDPRFTHNDYLQQGAEYGLIGLGLVLLTIWAHFFCAVRRVRNYAAISDGVVDQSGRLRYAFLVGSIAVISAHAVHACVDFHVRLFAIGIPIIFCLSIMAGSSRSESRRPIVASVSVWVSALCGLSILIMASTLAPSSWLMQKAKDQLSQNSPSAAISFLHEASEMDPSNPEPFKELAQIRYEKKNSEIPTIVRIGYISNALDAFQKVISINSLDWRANIGAGGCEMFLAWHSNPANSMGHWKRARSYLEKAIEIAPTKYEPREELALYDLDLAHFLASRGQLEDAYEKAKEAAAKFIAVPQFFVEGAPQGHRANDGLKSANNLLMRLEEPRN